MQKIWLRLTNKFYKVKCFEFISNSIPNNYLLWFNMSTKMAVLIVTCLCGFVFFILMKDAWTKFSSAITSTGNLNMSIDISFNHNPIKNSSWQIFTIGDHSRKCLGGKTWSAHHVLAIPMVLAMGLKLGTLTWTEFHQIQL